MSWRGKLAPAGIAIAAAICLCTAIGAGAAGTGPGAAGAAPADPPCQPWNVRTVATGLGVLENLEPDGHGGMLLSVNDQNAIARLTPDGKATTVISGVPSPGGQRIRGRYLYFNTGDSAQAGIAQTTDGTIQRYDMQTRSRITWASGLAMPNGLLFLPTGDPVVSRDSPGWGITRIPFDDPAHPQRNWVQTNDSNGLAVDPTGTWLYFDQTFQPGNAVMRARISNPSQVEQVASLGNGLVLDDMTIDRDGVLYIASNRPQPSGELIRFNPYTGAQCVIASGLADPSSVKFGCGPGWPSTHLFVTAFQGQLYDVSAPSGIPAPRGSCDAATGTAGAPVSAAGTARVAASPSDPAPAGPAASAFLKVSPKRVGAGQVVRVFGSTGGGCDPSSGVTLISRAFSRRHEFAGVPAIRARVRASGGFSKRTRIPAGRAAGVYSIGARCGGGRFGNAHLRVTH